ncbi:ABC transporter substrate-binding protein [Ascidiimonas sp. W6]|uniref:ABC transporter substrate-binding protein n=1 Tax=Ascidiimonas meishanensis TaxID=3128903 RepID=UPI0030EDCA43
MKKLTLALDWTPNINHIGFFIAKEKKIYEKLELSLNILDPNEDNYAFTPAKKVELGIADFALCPTESILSYRTKKNPFPLIAIATIFQEDLSALVVKQNKGIFTPKDLDGKTYSSYKARYEDAIVKQMIINDGGQGEINIDYPHKLGIWDTVLNDSFDATWIFLNWEGVEAASLAIPLSLFKMKDYNIPYSYSPVIATSENAIEKNKEAYTKFLEGTKQGFLYCTENPEECVTLFKKYIPEKDQDINLYKALEMSLSAFGNHETWGHIQEDVIAEFLQWIYNKKLETTPVDLTNLFTNTLNRS